MNGKLFLVYSQLIGPIGKIRIVVSTSNFSETEKGATGIDAKNRSTVPDSLEIRRESKQKALRGQFAAEDAVEPERINLARVVGNLAAALTVASVLASAALMLSDAAPHLIVLFHLVIVQISRAWALLGHAPLSALPLLFAGASYVALQALLRPAPLELFRRLMLGGAFLLWGVVQLMPHSELATDLGDIVIALYVFDLALMVQAELKSY
jgi:hypothetical protein